MLHEYNQKRNFKQTREPAGNKSKKGISKQLAFVVQRHHATRLHYDFRLQMDGVLKSWAVPKGPSLNAADKRLAVMVEDHPFDYRKFYGTIPEGNYGAGEVEIWDEGFYFPVNEAHEAITENEALKNLSKGELKVLLAGTHLKGEFVLVRMKKGEDNWLLIKHKDDYSVDKKYAIEKIASIKSKAAKAATKSKQPAAKKSTAKKAAVKKSPPKKSTAKKAAPKKATTKKAAKKAATKKATAKKAAKKSTGERTINKTNAGIKAVGKSRTNVDVKKIKPMLASTASEAFDNEEWIFEMKWDGYRCLASVIGNDVQLWSRNGLSFNKKFPAIVDALKNYINHDVVLDGEIIALVKGKSSFQALQHAEETKPQLQFCLFDLLFLDGIATTSFPLLDRKLLLEKLLVDNKDKHLQFTDHITGTGEKYFQQIEKKGLEGIMAKKADSIYSPGIRTKQWLKIKNRNDREAIIAGYTEGTGSRSYFGALILAEKVGSKYKYIGHTGTGFKEADLKSLFEKMAPLKTTHSPFDSKIKVNAPVTWLKPQLVCKVLFTEQTESGMLRHPVFAGIRTDKKASDVVEETEVQAPDKSNDSTNKKKKGSIVRMPGQSKITKQASQAKQALEDEEIMHANQELIVDKKTVAISNTDKIFFPEAKITKGDIIAYYNSIANFILPHLKDRPLSLKRNPNGIHGASFFHKNAGENVPSWIKTHAVHSESSNRNIEYIVCNNRATLLYLANLGCIEINPWMSTYRKPENPTYIAIDIDPSGKNTFEQVIETANAVKEVTDRAGLTCFCKTSGASGLHIYIPFAAKHSFDTLKSFGEIIAQLTHELVPDFTSLERSLKKRGNKIYVDYLQNRRGQTLASAYSLRPVVDASVSTPLMWNEVKKGLHPSQFTIFNIDKRVSAKGDLFAGTLTTKNDLRKAMQLLDS